MAKWSNVSTAVMDKIFNETLNSLPLQTFRLCFMEAESEFHNLAAFAMKARPSASFRWVTGT